MELAAPPARFVARLAVPVRDAVIVPAEKLPEESRLTIAEFVFKFVGVIQVGAPVPLELNRSPVVPTAVKR
jgi:hypothetical protein